jgi:hypothetical protein
VHGSQETARRDEEK